MITLNDFESALIQALQSEDATKWATGDTVNAAIGAGLHTQLGGIGKLEAFAAQATGRAKRTIQRRRLVSATFTHDMRNDAVAWETHTRIAELCKGDVDSACAWLDVAADDLMTADQIETAIKSADGDAERGQRVYLVRAASAEVLAVDGDRVVLRLDRAVELSAGEVITVTISRDDAQVTA